MEVYKIAILRSVNTEVEIYERLTNILKIWSDLINIGRDLRWVFPSLIVET